MKRVIKGSKMSSSNRQISSCKSRIESAYSTEYITRYKMEYCIDDGEKLVEYIYAETLEEAKEQLDSKLGVEYTLVAAIPESVPAHYKEWDEEASSRPNRSRRGVNSGTSAKATKYKGYYIVPDLAGDGYNVFNPDRELEDEGYASIQDAKKFIDSLAVEGCQVISAADRVSRADKNSVIDFAKDCKELGYTVENYKEFSEILRDQGMIPSKALYQIFLDNYGSNDSIESASYAGSSELSSGPYKMIITVDSGINADGFTVSIVDKDNGKQLFKQSYSYGYNASYARRWADERKPYVSDIIKKLRSQFIVDKNDVEVVAGKNHFRGDNVSGDAVKRFIENYLSESSINSAETLEDDYTPYTFMEGDQLEWSGLYGGQYKGVVTDVTDEYITVDVMWTAEDTGEDMIESTDFELSTDPEGRECIIVWTYGDDAGYVYPPAEDESDFEDVNSASNAGSDTIEGSLQKGDSVTLWWKDPEWDENAPSYASCEYAGRTRDGKYKFVSDTYGDTYLVDYKRKKVITPEGGEYDLDTSSGWTAVFDNSYVRSSSYDEYSEYDEDSEYEDDLTDWFNDANSDVIDAGWTEDGEVIVSLNQNAQDAEAVAEDLKRCIQDNDYHVIDWNTNGGNVFIFEVIHTDDYEEYEDGEDDYEEYEDDIREIGQEFTSENTSINSGKLPAVFNMVSFQPGTVNIDYGGGRFDNVADYLSQYDVINLVYDPYNRTPEHNKEVIRTVRHRGGADTATCSNVLNVIKEPEVRKNVLENIKKLVKPEGTIYITVYEGKGNGEGGPTKSGYQLNRKTADYLEEIQEVFPDAKRKGKLIVAHPTGSVNSATSVNSSTDEDTSEWYVGDSESGYMYTGKKNAEAALRRLKKSGVADAIMVPAEDESIQSEQVVEAGIYDIPEPSLDPPEDDSWKELDPFEETIQVELDAVVYVSDDGSWDYDDTEYPWAASDREDGDWYTDEYDVRIGDKGSIVEYVDQVIETKMPAEEGTYHIKGYVNLVFSVEGIEVKQYNHYYDERHGASYDEEVYTDNATTDFIYDKSNVTDFKANKQFT